MQLATGRSIIEPDHTGGTMRLRRAVLGTVIVATAVSQAFHAQQARSAPAVSRAAGLDRYDTAARISTAHFAAGNGTVIVATGENFPDALAGGAAGSKRRGPVLLTQRDALPPASRDELRRLAPAETLVIGGPGVVSDAVVRAIASSTGGVVTRVTGGDRYSTAAAVSAQVFAPGAPIAVIASGEGFADALAGGPAAGRSGGPVLLVTRNIVPTATAQELNRLRPARIAVLGGPAVVSDGVIAALGQYTDGRVERIAGADRIRTAVAVSKAFFTPGVPALFLATAANYPDALAAGSPGGIVPGPVLLTFATCVPDDVNDEIDRLSPSEVVVLGGPAVLGPGVESRADCTPTGPPPTAAEPTSPPTSTTRTTQTTTTTDPPQGAFTFGAGQKRVGVDVPAGTYRTRTDAPGCYWERQRGFSGSFEDIIANNFTNYHDVVTISPTDAGFKSSNCAMWTSDLSPITASPIGPFGPGTWIVNSDIAPGTWTAPGGSSCYWARLKSFSGEVADIITNDFGTASPVVAIAGGDVGFESSGCGVWNRA